MRMFWKMAFIVFMLIQSSFALEALRLPPVVVIPEGNVPIVLSAIHVESEVIGAIATSHITLTFYNPNNRTLEGNLEFPLKEGQTIESFALESLEKAGVMMPSSAVEKQKGEQVFESIERRNADPALLSQTQGNNFKLRLYPLLPKKKRTVRLDIVESLTPNASGFLSYHSALSFETKALKESSLSLTLYGVSEDKLIKSEMAKEIQASNTPKGVKLSTKKPLSKPNNRAIATWKASSNTPTIVSNVEDERYFITELPLHWISLSQKPAKHLAIIWDASGSGAQRNHAKELAFLDRYIQKLPKDETLHVHLSIVRNEAEPTRFFEIKNADTSMLRTVLENTPYDGATNASAWRVPKELPESESVALLFSDGLANWKESSVLSSHVPLFALLASTINNPRYLRHLAESNGGQLLDIVTMPMDEAISKLERRTTRITGLRGSGVEKLVLGSHYPQNGNIIVAGKWLDEKATITLTRQNPDGHSIEQSFILHPTTALTHPTFAAKRWAQFTINGLEIQSHLHTADITRLGKKFGLVTSQTSLLVLESFEDYVHYDVLPPLGKMRDAFLETKAKRELDSHAQKSQHLDRLLKRFNEKIRWWEKEFPKEDKKYEPEALAKSSGVMAMPPAVMSAAPLMIEAATPTPEINPPKLSIQLQTYTPNAAYAKRIKAAKEEERYAIYLDEKPNFLNSTAFYLDVADIFFEFKEEALALRILSNLAEMELENRHILRILAYRLQQANQIDTALPLLKRVLELSPHEPQSYRDLGLLYAKNQEYQKAVDTLWEVVTTQWDRRFADTDLIALGELNALVSAHKELDISTFDSRLLKNLPLDLRVVLSWDADDSDMDLWVTDPNDEKVYYAHSLSYQGGRISRDFTAGYGPEEFALKTAKKGTYEVRAHFYGTRQQIVTPYTTLMLKLSTAFGTDAQKDEHIILRLSGKNEDVLIGTFNVGD